MEETSIQLTLSEEEIKGLEKAVGWKIEDKEDLYQAVITVVLGYINDNKEVEKSVRMMGYARFNETN
jgi:hypothetical protein